MDENNKIQLFEDQAIRTAWDEEQEEWYFSIVDVVAILTEQKNSRSASTYWAVLKKRLKEEGADQLLTNCKQLKLKSPKDGKRYKTDVADTELSKTAKPVTFSENRQVAQTGGAIAGNTRREIEEKTGKPVISPENAVQLNRVVTDMIEGIAEIVPDEKADKDNENQES